MKQEQRKHEEEVEKMYANLWERDRMVKSEREEQTAKDQIERNREALKVSKDYITHWFSMLFA